MAEPTRLSRGLSQREREAVMEMAESVGLVWEPGTTTLPASHSANMMQIESTLLAFGDAVSMVHQLPLSRIGLDGDARSDTVSGGFTASDVVEMLRAGEADRDGEDRMEAPYDHLSRSELSGVIVDGLDMVLTRQDVLVINQGMPTLDNLYMAGSHRQGFRDWSRLRVGDRHWDLALACSDVVAHCGPHGLAVFLDGYGIDRVDPVRLDWYSHVVAMTRT